MGLDIGLRRLDRGVSRFIATAQNGLEVVRFGGLRSAEEPSPFEVVEHTSMYRLRRYFVEEGSTELPADAPVALLVPPPMVNADIYDVNAGEGAVAVLHRAGIDTWVVDFGSPAVEEGGWDRDLADHVLAVNAAIDTVCKETGRDVHLMGYSQGGMFAYQAGAFRHGVGVASIVTFGSPVDLVAGLPFGFPAGIAADTAGFLADHVVPRLPVTETMVRTGFQLLDPVKTIKSRIEFLLQLHDREALLPKERRRRFLAHEGWVGWSGPAIADVLRQFVAHNRMVSGGFAIRDQLVTLADLTCPILAFVGEVDDIGSPAAVRGIRRAAPGAQVYETGVGAGHFGLVAGSVAKSTTWPTVAQWVNWLERGHQRPESVHAMVLQQGNGGISVLDRFAHMAGTAVDVGAGIAESLWVVLGSAVRGSLEFSGEAARALPRLTRLGMIGPTTRISFGRLLEEQARRSPHGECFLHDGRVHTNAAVDIRINNVVKGLIEVGIRPAARVGVLMGTRPSTLVTVAALSRLGAVAVMLPPDIDLIAALELTGVDTVVADPENRDGAVSSGARVLVLGGGSRTASTDAASPVGIVSDDDIVDLEQVNPDSVTLPGWYRPDPGKARELAFVLLTGSGSKLEAKYITNHRWAVSAFGTASSADLNHHDTVYCTAPLHHASGLLVGVGSAVASGARIALSRTFTPERFGEDVRRYGVTVVIYTWTMMRDILDAQLFPAGGAHPIRLFLGSGMPPGLWRRTVETFTPAKVLEFYASTESETVLANVAGSKIGCKGRRVPGTAEVELAAYDPTTRTFRLDERGLVRGCDDDEVGLLLGRVHEEVAGPSRHALRGVFAAGDSWIPTDHLFRRDSDGDYWLMDHVDSVVSTTRGPVFTQPIVDVLNGITAVDLEVAYGRKFGGRTLVCAAVGIRPGHRLDAGDVTNALRELDPQQRPDIVYLVDDIPVSRSYRPDVAAVRAAGVPKASDRIWYYDRPTGSYHVVTEPGLFGG